MKALFCSRLLFLLSMTAKAVEIYTFDLSDQMGRTASLMNFAKTQDRFVVKNKKPTFFLNVGSMKI